MRLDRIAELLDPFLGPQDQRPNTQDLASSISTYIDILLRWNARINLTAIRNEEEIVTRHFGESLFAARHLFPDVLLPRERAALQGRVSGQENSGTSAPGDFSQDLTPKTQDRLSVADLGSGAGFPGIPIKLYAPDIHLTLIEANHKKATFLREVTRALTLTDIDILTARAETLHTQYDVVTLRAVERFETILPVAASLVRLAGRLALLIGSAQSDQARKILPKFAWNSPMPIPHSTSRILLLATSPHDSANQTS